MAPLDRLSPEHRVPDQGTVAELIAVVVAVTEDVPRVLTIDNGAALPSGPFASDDKSLQASLRDWVERQTHHSLGYVEQLYTFADADRTGEGSRVISISYLGLTREAGAPEGGVSWRGWYRYFPWEDAREAANARVLRHIAPWLRAWADAAGAHERSTRRQRVAVTFGFSGRPWSEELVLQRYELLYEAGLVQEAIRRRGLNAEPVPGTEMRHDHRRILATAIARLRAKIKYRPVVFELMPDEFTLLQLQRVFEALAGQPLHKQNFRRLIEQQALVEETGVVTTGTGGRPAKLFRFRKDVLQERAVAGSKLPLARSR